MSPAITNKWYIYLFGTDGIISLRQLQENVFFKNLIYDYYTIIVVALKYPPWTVKFGDKFRVQKRRSERAGAATQKFGARAQSARSLRGVTGSRI